ncbi:MAG: ABC transporter permease [Bacteroidales bacterium]|nr:ABC transporter permease [Bacteroidota bacterium]MBL6950190.1 ABC transporter permease [Bacteroidales bacterium]
MFERYIYILNIALEAVFLNKFRSVLTALGIIFGVAAVITMMAIGAGAQQEILDQMKLVGVNNILITPKAEKGSGDDQDSEASGDQDVGLRKDQKRFSPGLTLKDAESIKKIIPSVERISPEVIYETDVIKDGRRTSTKLTGITPDFFTVFGLELKEGTMFNEEQLVDGKPVCIIGPSIQSRFFARENPIGKEIKCGHIWLRVIGVLKKQEINQSAIDDLGISDYNNTIYAPIRTLLRRFKDRALVTSASLKGGGGIFFRGNFSIAFGGSQTGVEKNQIDKIVVQVKESSMISPTTKILSKMMSRRHLGVEDIVIKVPELLLRQEQRTKDIFNIVLGAIASISLLVGGIGIMNIMLASVMERIKEIGIRQAIGATKRDVIMQFLTEATLLSFSGGLIGIILGLIFSKIIMEVTGILTIISTLSIFISFGVSVSVGIIFGYMPAKRAASQDPVESLRHE